MDELSIVVVKRTKPLLQKTVYDQMKRWMEAFPDKPALVGYNSQKVRESLTYSELFNRAKRIAVFLRTSGLPPGGLVGVCMNNSLLMAHVFVGVCISGGSCFFIQSNMADLSDVTETVIENDITFLFIDGDNLIKVHDKSAIDKLLQINRLKTIINIETSRLELILNEPETLNNVVLIDDVINTDLKLSTFEDLNVNDVIVYFRTSGTTGKPKAVGHTHKTLLNAADCVAERFGMDVRTVWFCDRSFSWGLGSLRMLLATGCTRVFVDTRLSLEPGHTETVCDIIEAERCTHVYLPSYLATDILERPDLSHKFSTVVNINSSGERIPRRYSSMLGRYCRELCVWYGSQEAAGVTCFSSPNPDMYQDGIIGQPFPGITVKITDEHGHIVTRGQTGELCVMTPCRFVEYRGMLDKYHQAVDAEGWFHTGDYGYIRPDGNIVVKSRITDRITMGGSKYFPQPIENVIAKCAYVISVVVVPVPDKRMMNALCACIITKNSDDADMEQVKGYCDQTWSSYISSSNLTTKPRYFVQYEKFPSGPTGKIDRKALANDAMQRLGL